MQPLHELLYVRAVSLQKKCSFVSICYSLSSFLPFFLPLHAVVCTMQTLGCGQETEEPSRHDDRPEHCRDATPRQLSCRVSTHHVYIAQMKPEMSASSAQKPSCFFSPLGDIFCISRQRPTMHPGVLALGGELSGFYHRHGGHEDTDRWKIASGPRRQGMAKKWWCPNTLSLGEIVFQIYKFIRHKSWRFMVSLCDFTCVVLYFSLRLCLIAFSVGKRNRRCDINISDVRSSNYIT